jgi:hypothetical protein
MWDEWDNLDNDIWLLLNNYSFVAAKMHMLFFEIYERGL